MAALILSPRIDNIIYVPEEFGAPQIYKIEDRQFTNVSFSKTLLIGIEFRNCTFEDCLFQSTEFERCEFHECVFTCCNFNKSKFADTYIDPKVITGIFDPRDHANIGVHVFQQLRSNALNTHQPELFQAADWQFRRWKRHE